MKARDTCAVEWPREDIMSEMERECKLGLEIHYILMEWLPLRRLAPPNVGEGV